METLTQKHVAELRPLETTMINVHCSKLLTHGVIRYPVTADRGQLPQGGTLSSRLGSNSLSQACSTHGVGAWGVALQPSAQGFSFLLPGPLLSPL